MPDSELVLIPGAGGVGRAVLDHLRAQDVPVRVMVRREDDRSAELRALGVDVVLGDLTRPESVAAALEGVGRMYFAMPVSPDHLLAATVVATVAREHGRLAALVAMSQMTVSQMTATSTAESHQQRLHWLAEQVLNWSGLPVVHIRPTSFLDNPLFTTLAAHSIRASGTIALPSAPDAPRRSPWRTSPGWSPRCSATRLRTSVTSTS
ncbi:NAD(P)H-binding protein [Micromonospora sp. CPCC 205556]|uniref:NAD(P)H-binding protein n=1 Tax=Micromonospora sp. CPCC 205556 TaxID=3122398 RepID=UPI002FF0AE3D